MKKSLSSIYFTIFYLLMYTGGSAQTNPPPSDIYQEFTMEVKNDYRYFFDPPAFPEPKHHYYSIAIEPEYYLEWKDGAHRLKFTGFGRYETHETRRSHGDIRELYWQWVKGNWELSVGAKKIFWGVTESVHLVDVINQTDVVESFDGEQKLGQPMIHFSYLTNFGTIDAYYMPWFRRRQFPGREGRLRFPILVDKEDAIFESDLERFHPDLAVRWFHTLGPFDVGLSHFYGTGREPFFQLGPDTNSFEIIYPINHQTGIELQAVTGAILWKFESFIRANDLQETVVAIAVGGEYTIGNIAQSGLDIGVLAEYLYDNRDELAVSSLDNDLFAGARFAFNDVQDTQILMGGIFDLARSTKLYSVEGSRRFGSTWKAEIEARIFSDVANEEFLAFFQQDSFLQLRISKFF